MNQRKMKTMTDLRKLTTPLGLLDDETRERLKAHGGPYHFWTPKDGWGKPIPDPDLKTRSTFDAHPAEKSWCSEYVYRVYPDSVTKDSINWDHVPHRWICLARDQDGRIHLYDRVLEARRDLRKDHWLPFACRCILIAYSEFEGGDVSSLSSFKKGDCHWTGSLVFRPAYEPKGDQNDER